MQLCTKEQMNPKPDPDNIVFGSVYSDHMLEIEWTQEEGWQRPTVRPFHNLSFHPGVKCLHYAIQVSHATNVVVVVVDAYFSPYQDLLSIAQQSHYMYGSCF